MKHILITGGYGGMGGKTAELLAKNGFGVFALDKKVGPPKDNITPIQADITDPESVIAAYKQVAEKVSELYAVIHFAGTYMLDSLVEMGNNEFERAFAINLFGAFHVNKAFLPLLKEGSRIIITTSELATLDPLPFTGLYSVTKSALDKYAYSLSMELQLLGIRVSVVRAGAVDTGMLSVSTTALDRFCDNTRLYACNAARFKRIVDGVEARKVPPERIAKKVERILRAKRPAFAYSINCNPLLLILNALPKRLQLWIIRLILK